MCALTMSLGAGVLLITYLPDMSLLLILLGKR